MALMSMTGFGRGESVLRQIKVESEIGSVNRRQCEVRVNLPRHLSSLAPGIHKLVHAAVSRGQVTVLVKVSAATGGGSGAGVINRAVAADYVRQLRAVARELKLEGEVRVETVLQLPEAVTVKQSDLDSEKVWPLVRKSVKAALEAMVGMRAVEGSALEKDLRRRLDRLERKAERIRKQAPRSADKYRRALQKRIMAAGLAIDADDPQVVREIILFADKSDISEELLRLASHLKQGRDMLASTQPVGRALDFLCQEMFREINTIGSKSGDSVISRQVIEFKAELESVREQVQNVE